jgi:adenylate cyclase
MGTEIERKFLVRDDGWGPAGDGVRQRQGYLSVDEGCTVRVRITAAQARLTIKSRQTGLVRDEYEYDIPREDAERILATLCGLVVEKTRYLRRHGQHTWEIDVFEGDNAGLVTAEVELGHEQEQVQRPPWVGDEVSHDKRYRVGYLSRHPYREWRP